MAQDSRNALFMGGLIGSAVGFLLLISTEFGGSYYSSSYYGIETWSSVGPNGPLGFLAMFILGTPLLYCAMISFKGVRNPDSIARTTLSRAFRLCILQLAIVFIGAVVFAIAASDAEWWFGAGFYGSAIGGILTLIFLSSVRKSYTAILPIPGPEAMQGSPHSRPQQYPPSHSQQQSYSTYGRQSVPQSTSHGQTLSVPQPYQQPSAPTPPLQPDPSQQRSPGRPGFCSQCGDPLPSEARYCTACGSAVQ